MDHKIETDLAVGPAQAVDNGIDLLKVAAVGNASELESVQSVAVYRIAGVDWAH